MIVKDTRILSNEWMLIGQQEITHYGGRIDLLAIAPDGSLVLIELKRDRTPREIVAQALDYASWIQEMTADRIVQVYERFTKGGSLQEAFQMRFGTTLPYRNEGASEGNPAWAAHRRSLALQLQDLQGLRTANPSHHLVVAGDFNMTMEPCNSYVDKGSRAELLDALERLHIRCVTDDDCRTAVGRANIDHVLLSNDFKVTAPTRYWMAESVRNSSRRPLSDHNGVLVSVP